MSEATTPAPAGWYPDPAGGPRNRWWDGTTWTETFSEYPGAGTVAPWGTRTNNVWIWLAVFVPYITLPFLFTIDFSRFVDGAASGSARDEVRAQLALLTSPGVILVTVLGWLAIAAVIVVAYRDWRFLKTAGVSQPFHWAWAFLALIVNFPIYVIGRSVVVRSRTGTGLAPLWAAIVMFILAIVVSLIWAGNLVLGAVQRVPFS